MATDNPQTDLDGKEAPAEALPGGGRKKPPPLPSKRGFETPSESEPSEPQPPVPAPPADEEGAAPAGEPALTPPKEAPPPETAAEGPPEEPAKPQAAEEPAKLQSAEGAAEPQAAEAAVEPAEPDKPEPSPKPRRPSLLSHSFVRSTMAFLVSMILHLTFVIVLAIWVLPEVVESAFTPLVVESVDYEDDLETTFLEENTEAATEMVFGPSSGDVTMGQEISEATQLSDVSLDESLTENPIDASATSVEGVLDAMASTGALTREVPEGTPGRARHVVDGYQQAMDQITQEILIMLYKSPVLVVWVFDQSESMKDDQKEIRDRIDRVYEELNLSERSKGERLTSAVTSFGQGFQIHTELPTANLDELQKAIDAVPVDPSGEEFMCQAVGKSIAQFRKYAARGGRRMALILVTDESGNRQDNVAYLEATVAEAKAARCKIYVLGREACFGYPYVYFRYVHPQTNRPHWLRVDRGPETAFVEQIQTNGFRRRYDAFPSGYGPYEQSRLARETGGIFFLLPSLESKLVRGEKRRYELEAMEFYKPDLRARQEIIADRDRYPLRTLLWGIISDLNPYNENSAKVIELRDDYSPNIQTFIQQVAKEQQKAKVYLQYLDQAEKELDKNKHLRDREPEHRWQANFDLLYAQIIAYKVRVYEFGAYLEAFKKNPKVVPLTKPPNKRLTHFDLTTRKEQLMAEVTKSYVEKATELLEKVIEEHPGTPWAARAQWELRRGYGVDLVPAYEPPYKDVKNPSPLPKL